MGSQTVKQPILKQMPLCLITNLTRIGVFAQGQILCISPNGLQADHCDATFDCISRHFRSMRNLNFF